MCLQIIAKKFSVACPLFDPAVFEHTHDAINGTLNSTVDHVTEEMLVGNMSSLSTSIGKTLNDLMNSTEPFFLHPEQEKGAKELYETYGPQECKAEPFALTNRVSYFNLGL